jgi:uncharacterized RDD family membrane protein YckC
MKYSDDSVLESRSLMELAVKRLLAFIIDGLIISVPTLILTIIFGILTLIISLIPIIRVIRGFFAISAIGITLFFFYEVVSMYLFQTTLGKKLVGLEVLGLRPHGEVDIWTILLRSFVKAVSISGPLAFLTVINGIYMLIKDEHGSIHDIIAGSSVWQK